LEAIIGAIYLDQENIAAVRIFLERKILHELFQILLTEDVRNPITPLQEICQREYGKVPDYRFTELSGTSSTASQSRGSTWPASAAC
jgi:dsRNA-specific ribonuclease